MPPLPPRRDRGIRGLDRCGLWGRSTAGGYAIARRLRMRRRQACERSTQIGYTLMRVMFAMSCHTELSRRDIRRLERPVRCSRWLSSLSEKQRRRNCRPAASRRLSRVALQPTSVWKVVTGRGWIVLRSRYPSRARWPRSVCPFPGSGATLTPLPLKRCDCDHKNDLVGRAAPAGVAI